MPKVFLNNKSPCGKCYFSDGTIEDIISYIHYSEESIVFFTKSGKYHFRMRAEPLEAETLYADNNPYIMMVPKHGFYKFVSHGPFEPEAATHLVNIDKIEIE